jgi:hypothetical protein
LRDSSLLCFNNVWPAKAVDAQAVADAIATPRNTSSTTHKRLGEQRQREVASGKKDAEEDCRAKGRWLFLCRIDLGIDPMTEILLHQWRTTQSGYDTVTPLR